MTKLVIDLETDGLLQQVTKIHCISVVDLDSSYSELYVGAERIQEFIDKVKNDTSIVLIGHNLFNYDLKVIEKLYGVDFTKTHKIEDTLVLGQLLFSDLRTDDEKNTHNLGGKIFSKKDTGSHSLKAYGQRIICYKGEYTGGWEEYNDEMGAYCIKDTYTTKALYKAFQANMSHKLLHSGAIDLEYSISPILARQQAYGVLFDREKADNLILTLTYSLVEAKQKLTEIFKPRYVFDGTFTPKITNKTKGYTKGQAFSKVKLEEFNPGSRTQIVDRLKKEFAWNPEEFTEKGNAKMDEDIIENLPFPQLAPLKEYLTIKKRISQIETGRQAWLKKIDDDGRIRGAIRQNGAVTGRMAHFSPNMAQIPSNDSLYGRECRELFRVSKGKIMIGCDADALEMRCLAGYLHSYDGGKFMRSVLEGNKEDGTDPHSINMHAYELDQYENGRDCSKTLFYASIYGSKNAKNGKILMDYGVDFEDYVPDFEKSVIGMLEWVAKKNKESANPMVRSDAYWRCWVAGKHATKLFGERIPELDLFRKDILDKLKEKGYIKGLDGRKLFCRSEHGALNTVLQSAGALIMKKALAIADTDLTLDGLRPGIDYEFILNVHDEFQLEVTNDQIVVDKVRGVLENSIIQAQEFFNFPCPMKMNSQIGLNWSLTH